MSDVVDVSRVRVHKDQGMNKRACARPIVTAPPSPLQAWASPLPRCSINHGFPNNPAAMQIQPHITDTP